MISIIEVVGERLGRDGVGVYDAHGLGGNIFAGNMNGKDNNQIVLQYRSVGSFLGGTNPIGELTIKAYNRNYPHAVEMLENVRTSLSSGVLERGEDKYLIVPTTDIEDVDVSNITELLCVQSKYKTQKI